MVINRERKNNMIKVMDYNAKCSTEEVRDDTTVDPLMAICDSCTYSCSCSSGCDSSKPHERDAYSALQLYKPSGI
jgi:hypothetical protein